MPTSHAQTPYITPYIIHQHSGYEDPSVNNCEFTHSSYARPLSLPRVAYAIRAQYRPDLRDTPLHVLLQIQYSQKPPCLPLPIRARRYDFLVPARDPSTALFVHTHFLPPSPNTYQCRLESFHRKFASLLPIHSPSRTPHVSQRQNAFPSRLRSVIGHWTHSVHHSCRSHILHSYVCRLNPGCTCSAYDVCNWPTGTRTVIDSLP
jgi:hypothetical protein